MGQAGVNGVHHYFDLTCREVMDIDSFTEYDEFGEIAKVGLLSEADKKELNERICSRVIEYADKMKFINTLGLSD